MLAKRRLLTWCDDGGTNGSVPTGRTRVLVEESRWAGCSARLQRAIQGNRSSLVAKERPITATAVIGGLPARSLSGRSRRTAVSAYTQGNAPWSGSKCVQAGTGSAPIRRPLDSTTSRKCGVGHAEQAFRCLSARRPPGQSPISPGVIPLPQTRPALLNGSKQHAFRDAAGLLPVVDRRLHPTRYGNGTDVPRLAQQVGNNPVCLTQLDRTNTQREQFASSESTSN